MEVYEIRNGEVSLGAKIETIKLKCDVEIDCIVIGEEGRGRKRGILPTTGVPIFTCPNDGKKFSAEDTERECPSCGEKMENENGAWKIWVHSTGQKKASRIYHAQIGQTKAGKPKIFWAEASDPEEKEVLIVFRTYGGFRGHCAHKGDEGEWEEECPQRRYGGFYTGCEAKPCEKCGEMYKIRNAVSYQTVEDLEKKRYEYVHPDKGMVKVSGLKPFPGKVIVEGNTAEGAAGRAGFHEQIVAVMPKQVVFSTHYFGRRYGNPAEHFYMYVDRKIIVLTKQEREVSGIF